MNQSLRLPYGSRPYIVSEWPARTIITTVHAPEPRPCQPLRELLDAALNAPIAAPRLEDSVEAGSRVVVVVSDATRDDPRDEMVRALLERLPDDIELTIAVANGTHGPCDLTRLGLGADIWARAGVVNHDAHDPRELMLLGQTRRGTPVRIHRCVAHADLVIATGRIKPHYFAGYGAGCKAIFPGLGGNREIRINHELKMLPNARPGIVDNNPCRDDLEEAVAMVPARRFLLNIVVDAHGGNQLAVAGDVREAFAVGAKACDPLFRVRAPRSDVVIVSDELPLTGSLYQASKLVASAAGLLRDSGTMIVVAECPEGVGPVETVNQAIYEIGLRPRLPAQHRIVLVSGLSREQVAATYCEWAPSVEAVLAGFDREPICATVVPRAGTLILEPEEA